jgi:hypothetical protein
MAKFKQKLVTYISIYRIIKFIKESKINAFTIGTEMASIYCLIYTKFKDNPNINANLNTFNIYHLLLKQPEYNKFKISKFLNKHIIFSKFFSILNTKILRLKDQPLWNYLRGYYINDLDISTNNLNGDKKQFWFILYDFHLHYLLFIYSIMNKDFKNIVDIDFLLNNKYDNYSINYVTDDLNYKLAFIHDPNKFNDSIKNVLKMFYLNVTSEKELFSKEDILMYRKYILYLNN